MPDDRAVFENVPSAVLQPKSAWCVLFGGVWRKPLEILRGEGKAYVMGLRHAGRSTESLGKWFLFLLDNMALVLGASKGRSSAPSLNHTCREICVISLATFTVPVCRWIASETYPADEPSRSKRYRPRMHSDVDQDETSTGLTPDSELFSVLFAEAARVAGEEVQPRKPSRVRRHKSREDQYISKHDAKKKDVCCTSSTTSRFSLSRTEPPQPRFCVTQSRSTSFWPVEDNEKRAEVCW